MGQERFVGSGWYTVRVGPPCVLRHLKLFLLELVNLHGPDAGTEFWSYSKTTLLW